MADDARAVERAREAFQAAHGGDPATVRLISVAHERIPNPPLQPGQVSIDPVLYRYFIELRSPVAAERYCVEGNHVTRT